MEVTIMSDISFSSQAKKCGERSAPAAIVLITKQGDWISEMRTGIIVTQVSIVQGSQLGLLKETLVSLGDFFTKSGLLKVSYFIQSLLFRKFQEKIRFFGKFLCQNCIFRSNLEHFLGSFRNPSWGFYKNFQDVVHAYWAICWATFYYWTFYLQNSTQRKKSLPKHLNWSPISLLLQSKLVP